MSAFKVGDIKIILLIIRSQRQKGVMNLNWFTSAKIRSNDEALKPDKSSGPDAFSGHCFKTKKTVEIMDTLIVIFQYSKHSEKITAEG